MTEHEEKIAELKAALLQARGSRIVAQREAYVLAERAKRAEQRAVLAEEALVRIDKAFNDGADTTIWQLLRQFHNAHCDCKGACAVGVVLAMHDSVARL